MALSLIVTNAGRAAIVNAQNTGTAPVTIAQLGLSASVIAPTAATAALAGEFKRLGTVSGDTVADDTIHMIGRDEGADIYTVRAIALYLGDGTLFAIYGQATPIVKKSASSIMLMAIDVKFADIAPAALTFGNANFLNPPATETVQGVAELATQAESDTGTDDLRIVTPKKNRASFLSWMSSLFGDIWRASNDGSGSGLDADLLDGQQGSWYSAIAARLGYTPANKAGETFTGNIVAPSVYADAVRWNQGGVQQVVAYIPEAGTLGISTNRQSPGNERFFAFWADGRFTIGGHTGWHGGNDGAGSGLDADLLDGQHGAYYADINARLGYTALNAATYTAADIKAKLITVDGSGSGLDADLLDGIDSTGFIKAETNVWQVSTDGVARFFFTPNGRTVFGAGNVDGWGWHYDGLNRATLNTAGEMGLRSVTANFAIHATNGTGSALLGATGDVTANRGNGTGLIFLGGSGTRYVYFDGSSYSMPGADLYVNGSKAWTAANDGAGSGLDADLLDGQDSSYFTNIAARLGFTPANRAGDTFTGNVGAPQFYLTGAGNAYWTIVSGSPQLVGDANDYYYYDRATDYHGFAIGGAWQGGIRHNGVVEARIGFIAAGNTVWHAGNDGAGSGLDADLLDGQDSSYFTNIAARLGYTPANRAGESFTGGISAPSVDITGGDLFLARTNDSWGYIVRPATAGFRNLGFTCAGGAQLLDHVNFNSALVTRQGVQVWDGANDGAGSGLDADLLDGMQASAFALLSQFESSIGSDGYIKLPGGLIIQWKNVATSAGGSTAFNWPIAFPNACFVAVPGGEQGLNFSGSFSAYLNGVTRFGGSAYGNNGSGAGGVVAIIAIGN